MGCEGVEKTNNNNMCNDENCNNSDIDKNDITKIHISDFNNDFLTSL